MTIGAFIRHAGVGGREADRERCRRVALVSCGRRKLNLPAAAKDLYASPRFKLARAVAEATGDPWFVLSALHGLVAPDEVIAPYDLTLSEMSRRERVAWSDRVWHDLSSLLTPGDEVLFLAGKLYRCGNESHLRLAGYRTSAPLAGLGSGWQLRKLKAMLENGGCDDDR